MRTPSGMVSLWFASFLFLTACGYFDYDGTKTQPSRDALVGTWSPDGNSLKYMRTEGGYDASVATKLVLRADGSFEMNNMPDWFWIENGVSNRTFRTTRGTWEASLDPGAPYWVLLLRYEGSEGRFDRIVALLGQKPPYKLRFGFGIADRHQHMTFVKINE